MFYLEKRLETSRWWVEKEIEKRVSKRVCQMDILSNQFIGLEYQVRNAKIIAKNEMIAMRAQLIINRIFLFKP